MPHDASQQRPFGAMTRHARQFARPSRALARVCTPVVSMVVSMAVMMAVVAAMALVLTGCPTFEDTFSGTYHELEFELHQDEVLAIEFFRFGSDARAVLRYYRRAASSTQETPFLEGNQTRCVWTKADRFDEQSYRFNLPIPVSARRPAATVSGVVTEAGKLEVRIIEDGQEGEPRDIKLSRVSAQANARCDTVDDFLIRAVFDEQASNTLDAARYTLRNPVLTIMWVGVEPIQRDGTVIYAAFNRPEPTVRLEAGRHFSRPLNGLQSSLSFLIPPPGDRILVQSGNTRYALAHFVVIDDAESEGRFAWNISDEPIVATSLQPGRRDDAPPDLRINGWGKALLYVEGALSELDDNILFRLEGLEEADETNHFYIVDVFFFNDEVVLVQLPERPRTGPQQLRYVPVQMTDSYLERREVLLPRLY